MFSIGFVLVIPVPVCNTASGRLLGLGALCFWKKRYRYSAALLALGFFARAVIGWLFPL